MSSNGMVEAVFAEIELPAPDAEWKPALLARSASLRAVLTRHPWAASEFAFGLGLILAGLEAAALKEPA